MTKISPVSSRVKQACEGMSLIEVLLALLILFTTAMVVVQALSAVLRLEGQSQVMREAVPIISTLVHDQYTTHDHVQVSTEVDGWTLQPRNLDDDALAGLMDLFSEDLPGLQIPLML